MQNNSISIVAKQVEARPVESRFLCLRYVLTRQRFSLPISFSTLLYLKFLILWILVILADFILEFRFEFLWPFYLLLRSVYDSFKYQGLAFSLFFVLVALTSDMLCFFFIPVHWLFFAASTYVWVQYVWHTDRGICAPTVVLWILFVYIEAAVRLRDVKHMPGHLDLCRPFAAHCIGYPVVTLGFGFKSYVGYRMRQRRQQVVAKENQFYMQLMQQALPMETAPPDEKTEPTAGAMVPLQQPVQNANKTQYSRTGLWSMRPLRTVTTLRTVMTWDFEDFEKVAMFEDDDVEEEEEEDEEFDEEEEEEDFRRGGKKYIHTYNKCRCVVRRHSHERNGHIPNGTIANGSAHGGGRQHHHHHRRSLEKSREQQHGASAGEQHDQHRQQQRGAASAHSNGHAVGAGAPEEPPSSPSAGRQHQEAPEPARPSTRRREKREQDKEREAAEYLQRLEGDARRLRADLQASRASEQELRLQVASLTTTDKVSKGELSAMQREIEDLQQRLQSALSTKSSDKQTIGNLERRIAEERRLRSSLESQLNQERKSRKQEEARAAQASSQAAAQQSSRGECVEACKARRRDLESELAEARSAKHWQDERLQALERENTALAEQLRDTDILMSALSAMQEKNVHLENSLSAETRIKLDLFSALGEAKRQLEIRENANRAQEKEIEELKGKIAQVLAVMPNDSSGGPSPLDQHLQSAPGREPPIQPRPERDGLHPQELPDRFHGSLIRPAPSTPPPFSSY
ncbi:hypothetical protein NQ318_022356 [Aromia moschata]|uniref:Macoilin n=1 Tax=Aromia moschata TaxID=1265417 RepID=A0AAV8Z4L7_9CUCU|nr:hypothetical protein NQ318_022356 [Aromia moschata]